MELWDPNEGHKRGLWGMQVLFKGIITVYAILDYSDYVSRHEMDS